MESARVHEKVTRLDFLRAFQFSFRGHDDSRNVRENASHNPHAPHDRSTHTTRNSFNMSRIENRTGKRKRERDAREAIPGLPEHIVVTHILRSQYFDDPADPARLPAVSPAMRDAVKTTGLAFEELNEERAVHIGCVSALRQFQRQGLLRQEHLLCQAAARSGQLEELKMLRETGYPWNQGTCAFAASGGQLEVLQWAIANSCPCSYSACEEGARRFRRTKMLTWLHVNRSQETSSDDEEQDDVSTEDENNEESE